MKIVDKYIKLKKRYPNYIVLIKCGNFYNTYFDDAILLSCLCSYKLIGNKIGFPNVSLNKVVGILKCNNINYILI